MGLEDGRISWDRRERQRERGERTEERKQETEEGTENLPYIYIHVCMP